MRACTSAACHPITPATSVRVLQRACRAPRPQGYQDGKNNFAILQAEDELGPFGIVHRRGLAGSPCLHLHRRAGITCDTSF